METMLDIEPVRFDPENLDRIIEVIETINEHSDEWDADDMEKYSEGYVTWNGSEDAIGTWVVLPFLKELQELRLKAKEK